MKVDATNKLFVPSEVSLVKEVVDMVNVDVVNISIIIGSPSIVEIDLKVTVYNVLNDVVVSVVKI